ncbi:MAG: RtcB family protein [Clostridia bacterium]|nr:RtcB family protein [Clostridia bacterium]
MLEVKGKYNTAKVFTDVIEETAIDQIRLFLDQPFSENAKVRMMPDVHAGAGCTIGTTMTVTDKVIPNAVGVDIGCGMLTVNLGKAEIDLPEFDKACHSVPSGMNVWPGRKEPFDLQELRCFRSLKDTRRLDRSLGTLGGGNHFIELDRDDEGNIYLVIHTGSRNLGKQVAEIYQRIAVDLAKGKEEYFIERERIIKEYKEAGRRKEIQDTLKKMEAEYDGVLPSTPKDLCYLYGSYMEDYLHDVAICQRFASRNRELIAETILSLTGLREVERFETIHNYISISEMILRKGAVSAKEGEKLLIPINMRDGSLICIGKGNPDWNCSAPHGAGRLYGRMESKRRFTVDEFEESMKGIYSTTINEKTLDECPMAYKDMKDIVENITPTAEIVKIIKPIYNFKADN